MSTLKRIFNDKFFRQNALLFFFSQVGSLFNFLFQYFTSHVLTKSEYGLLNSLLSSYLILVIPMTTIQTTVLKYVSECHAKNQYDELKYFYSVSIRNLILISCIFFVIIYLFQGYLASFYHVEASFVFFILGGLVVSGLFLYFGFGFLQGFQKFLWVGICLGFMGFFRFGNSYVLRFFSHYSVFNILLALFFASLIILLPIVYQTWRLWTWPFGKKNCFKSHFKETFWYAFPSLIAYSALSAVLYMDLILARHFLKGDEAGLYATVSVLGKAVFYLSLSVIMVMFPKVTESQALGKTPLPFLFKALGFSICVSGGMLSIFILFPEVILEFFGKKEALAAVSYLRWYAGAMFFMAMLYIVVNYFIAIANFSFLKPLLGILILEIVGICLFHRSLEQILGIFISTLILMVGTLVFLLWNEAPDKRQAVLKSHTERSPLATESVPS